MRVATCLLLLGSVAGAAPCEEAHRFATWKYGWAITYGGLTAAQLTLAATHTNPLGPYDDRFRDTLYIGSIESGLGSIAMLVTPGLTCDPIADGRAERTLFFGGHIGNFLVNAAGSLILAHYATWSDAALSFAIGYPIGLLNTYTMPRHAWHVLPTGNGIAIAGVF
ncbi:MAG: hypothetical protein QM831_42965 [Kofleriaceae bacterium]